MRIQTNSVPSTKYFEEKIHVRVTDDNNVPDNRKDRSYIMPNSDDKNHERAVELLLEWLGMAGKKFEKIGNTLTKRGYVYQIEDDNA